MRFWNILWIENWCRMLMNYWKKKNVANLVLHLVCVEYLGERNTYMKHFGAASLNVFKTLKQLHIYFKIKTFLKIWIWKSDLKNEIGIFAFIKLFSWFTHTHTQTHKYIYMYIWYVKSCCLMSSLCKSLC